VLRGLTDLIEPLRHLLPTEVLVLLAIALAIVVAPAWWRSVRVRQIKGHVRRAARAHGPAERRDEVDGAFRKVGGSGRLLVDLAEHAHRAGLHDVWQRAVEKLERSGKLPLESQRLRHKAAPPPRALRDRDEAVVRAELQLSQELWAAARETLDEALARFPDDPDIARLDRALRDRPSSPARPGDPNEEREIPARPR